VAQEAGNPLEFLTFIAAPALLTNATSLLILSTSNRFARAVDRARQLAREAHDDPDVVAATWRAQRRALMLVRALTAYYIGVGVFSGGAFAMLVGGGIASITRTRIAPIIIEVGLALAMLGTLSIAVGAISLVAETWHAYVGLAIEERIIRRGALKQNARERSLRRRVRIDESAEAPVDP